MNQDINYQQAFAWAIQMTAQTDYQSLTHDFLRYLEQFPFVSHAAAYEIYGERSLRTGQAASGCEQLVRRFPLDIGNEEPEEDFDLLREIQTTLEFNPSKPDSKGLYTQVLASIRDVSGPDRAILLYGEFDASALELIASSIVLYRNQVALHDAKERDPLTKLPNRQSFEARIQQVGEHFRSRPLTDKVLDKSSWIAMLDLDHFKRINDNYGHMQGDQVLLIFSRLLEKYFRYNDFLFRFGGEEFVVILNLVNQADANGTFQRFREGVAAYKFPVPEQISVSIGAAHIDGGVAPEVLLDRADQALYASKKSGRNRLTIYESLEQAC
ncbi:MAG: GGDEF domain-containing protein [Methylomonas sp.]|jgi:diguanylate cyclase (GGDEF)-like protein